MTDISTQTTSNPLIKRFILFIVVISIFIGINVFSQALIQPASTIQTGDAGDLLYAAGFDGFTDEWQQYQGQRSAVIDEGVITLALETPDIIYSASPLTYEDFDLRVTVRSIEGDASNDGYGVIFRLSESNETVTCQYQFVILCALEQVPVLDTGIALLASDNQPAGYYVFLISNDGYYQILRGDTETNALDDVTVWHYSNGLLNEGVGAENQIRVVGQGNQFSFFLNGEPALLCVPLEGEQPTGNADDCLGEETYIWEDTRFSQGKLGLILNGATMAGDRVEFDNFTVTMPNEIIIEGNNA